MPNTLYSVPNNVCSMPNTHPPVCVCRLNPAGSAGLSSSSLPLSDRSSPSASAATMALPTMAQAFQTSLDGVHRPGASVGGWHASVPASSLGPSVSCIGAGTSGGGSSGVQKEEGGRRWANSLEHNEGADGRVVVTCSMCAVGTGGEAGTRLRFEPTLPQTHVGSISNTHVFHLEYTCVPSQTHISSDALPTLVLPCCSQEIGNWIPCPELSSSCLLVCAQRFQSPRRFIWRSTRTSLLTPSTYRKQNKTCYQFHRRCKPHCI